MESPGSTGGNLRKWMDRFCQVEIFESACSAWQSRTPVFQFPAARTNFLAGVQIQSEPDLVIDFVRQYTAFPHCDDLDLALRRNLETLKGLARGWAGGVTSVMPCIAEELRRTQSRCQSLQAPLENLSELLVAPPRCYGILSSLLLLSRAPPFLRVSNKFLGLSSTRSERDSAVYYREKSAMRSDREIVLDAS